MSIRAAVIAFVHRLAHCVGAGGADAAPGARFRSGAGRTRCRARRSQGGVLR